MEKDRFLERVSAATGIQEVLREMIDGAADALERLEKRIEALEDGEEICDRGTIHQHVTDPCHCSGRRECHKCGRKLHEKKA